MTALEGVPLTDENGVPLFSLKNGKPQLIGAKCRSCGTVLFPKRPQCPRCFTETMEETLLSTRGKVFSSTVLYKAPGAPFEGDVPYSIGNVELPEKVLIQTRFCGFGDSPYPIGTEVDLQAEVCGKDEDGNPQLMHTFVKV